jgi:hypothetical protein
MIIIPPHGDDMTTDVKIRTCAHHKLNPTDTDYAGCSCSSTYTYRCKTKKEKENEKRK